MELINYIQEQKEWSLKTFGPGNRVDGVIDHIKKELEKIKDKPKDLEEWVDVIILALDGAWRAGFKPWEICFKMRHKQLINKDREWPDWKTAKEGKAIEHIRD